MGLVKFGNIMDLIKMNKNSISKIILAASTFLLMSCAAQAQGIGGCSVLGGWPGAQYGLQGQLITDAIPCYGITGTRNSPIVLQTAPTITAPFTVSGANARAIAVGRLGITTPGFQVDSSNASSITGLAITAQASGNGVNLTAIGETNVPIAINAAGNGTINLNASGTGVVSSFRNLFINHDSNPTITLGSAGGSLAHLTSPGTSGTAFTTGGGDQVTVLNTASSSRQVTLTGSNGANPSVSTSAGNLTLTSNTGHLIVEGVTSTGATGTGNFVFSAAPTFTGTAAFSAATMSTPLVKSSGGTGNTAESWQYIETLTASGSANLTTSTFTSAFDNYMFIIDNIVPVTDGAIFNATVESGGTFQSTSYKNVDNVTTADVLLSTAISNTAGQGISLKMSVNNVNSTSVNKFFIGREVYFTAQTTLTFTAVNEGGYWNGGQGAVTRVRWQMSTGNISTGIIKVYGLRNN